MTTIWYWSNGMATKNEWDKNFLIEAHKYPEPNKIEVPYDTSWKKIRKAVNMAIAEDLEDAIQGDEITHIWVDEADVVVRDVDFGDEPPDRGYINDDD